MYAYVVLHFLAYTHKGNTTYTTPLKTTAWEARPAEGQQEGLVSSYMVIIMYSDMMLG